MFPAGHLILVEGCGFAWVFDAVGSGGLARLARRAWRMLKSNGFCVRRSRGSGPAFVCTQERAPEIRRHVEEILFWL